MLDVESDADLTGCPDCGVVAVGHGRHVQILHDAPCFGTPVRVRWRKRIWRCPEPSCRRGTWTEEHDFAPPRAKLTSRAVEWTVSLLRLDDTTVSAIARRLGVNWHTCWNAVRKHAETSTSGGKLVFHVFGALAEFERDLIWERTQAGLRAARARGRQGGRPRALDPRDVHVAQQLYHDKTTSVADICWTLRISRATLYKYLKTRDGEVDLRGHIPVCA